MQFRYVAGWALAAIMSVCPAYAKPAPNIVFILTDDLGWGDLAVYGHPELKTPGLDRLASRGTLFTQFYVASPVCSPSRASILTGQFAPETGIHYAIGGEGGRRLNSEPWLDPDATTVYDVFGANGYRIGHFGKWHLGAQTEDGKAPAPEAYGIHSSATTNSTGPRLTAGKMTMAEETLGEDTPNGKQLPRSASTAAIVDAAMTFIDESDDQPFFVSLWTLEPHAILDPTEEQMRPYLNLTHPSVRDHLKSSETIYYASVSNIDRQLTRLFDYLDAHELTHNTIVVFTSDNGPAPLWAASTGHAGAGLTGPFRGTKASLYEGGIRVPFIVSWPGRLPAGRVDTESVVGAVDLFETLAELAGISDIGVDTDGEDMSATFLGQSRSRAAPLLWEFRGTSWGRTIQQSPRLAMRQGDWKLLMNPDGSRVELYNLANHPNETANVADYEPERAAELRARLLGWFNQDIPTPEKVVPQTGKAIWHSPGVD